MSKESILKIKEVESQAERIVEEARLQAQEMVEKAEREGKLLCEKAETETLENRNAMLQRIDEKTAQLAEQSMEEAKAEAEELRRSVSLRRKSAEKIIIRGLDSKCR